MKKNQVFGGKCGELLGIYDPESLSWKTCQMSFTWAEPMSLDRLPKSGTTVNGQLFEQVISELPIGARGGFVFPMIPEESKTRDGLLPTPTATGSEHRTRYSQGGRPLMYMLMKGLLPTPTASDPLKHSTRGLHRLMVRGQIYSDGDHRSTQKTKPIGHKTQTLNPQFVVWMMGFPIDWLD